TSEAPAWAPIRIWASIPAWSRPLPRSTTITRQGCSRLALLAATTAASASSPEATITRVSTRPRVTTPPSSRRSTRRAAISAVLVSSRVMITAASRCDRPGPASLHPTPGPGARPVRFGPAMVVPVVDDRVENLPGQLDLSLVREQRRVTGQHVQQQPFVGLRGGFGERVPVTEVHGHVPYFHGRAGNLRAEPDGHALVRLHPDDQSVLTQLLCFVQVERQVRGAFEHHRDLGHPASQTLSRPQVERHAGPP